MEKLLCNTSHLETIRKAAKASHKEAMQVVRDLYEHPEIGGQEYYAHQVLSDFLEEKGFYLTRHYIMETAFLAGYGNPDADVKIAFLAEYDALPEIGHGCGHNLIQAFSVLAALAIKECIDPETTYIAVVGTPAEENLGGKITMNDAGAFNAFTACLMIHPSNRTQIGSLSSALQPMRFEFFGKSAHAARPYEGASALDAAVATYTNIQFMRQFAPKESFIHGVLTHGGKAANVIPDYACLDYYFRAPLLKTAVERAEEATTRAAASAKANRCEMKASVYETPYGDTLPNLTLAELMRQAFEEEGVENVEDFDYTLSGSTDVGAVSYTCPTLQAYLQIAAKEVQGHSKELAAATISPIGEDALYKGAVCLARLAATVINDETVRSAMQEEHITRLKENL